MIPHSFEKELEALRKQECFDLIKMQKLVQLHANASVAFDLLKLNHKNQSDEELLRFLHEKYVKEDFPLLRIYREL